MIMASTVFSRMICGDARNLKSFAPLLERRSRAIITSPPYLDTQDYGEPEQIGFRQSREEYLGDLRQVFERCWELSTDDATMWLVVGAVRRSGRLVQLPEILSSLATEAGWIPREQITWAKGKSLPWARPGEFRDVTEQAILLSKSDIYLFDLSDLLSPDPTSPWWRRYPERYSPGGRRPTNLWNIPIPTQGAWREGPGHLCPFPYELTFRMISLSTEPGDVILDPFAGVGSVPAMANTMERLGYGVEISQRYVDRFPVTWKQSQEWLDEKKLEIKDSQNRHKVFFDTIVQLRLLKFASLIGKRLISKGYPVEWIHVIRDPIVPEQEFKIVTGDFEVKVGTPGVSDDLLRLLHQFVSTRPLSKFGVQPVFHVAHSERTVSPRYWFENAKYWLEPITARPDGSGPHLSSDFLPGIDAVSEVLDRQEEF